MKIPFYKMHGAGNDFVLIDDRMQRFPIEDVRLLRWIGRRRDGVGCEGIILLQPSTCSDLRMRFFNPDGAEVEMCGNGARCFARLAYVLGAAPMRMRIETIAGEVQAEVRGSNVCLQLPDPVDICFDVETVYGLVNYVVASVPHVVSRVEAWPDLYTAGASIRYDDAFAPAGTNANFVQVDAQDRLLLRTYERGVEAETAACGTGAVASAVVAVLCGWVKAFPVKVVCSSGAILEIGGVCAGAGVRELTLTGPAVTVYEGVMDTENMI